MLLSRAFFILMVALAGCVTDYAIVAPGEIIYIETEVEVEVEVEKEVPAGEVWVDSFDQPMSSNGVDIIWVIDQSCSMHDDSARIVNGIEAMLNALPPYGWRLNIISSDPNKALYYREFPLVPGDTLADAKYLFNKVASVYAPGESGLSAAYDYIAFNPEAAYWMRPDAALLVVFVSDEDDGSTTDFPAVVPNFTTWYSSLRPSGSTFVASIVHLIPDESLCNASPTWAGERYIEAANYYNGTVVDICSEDWASGVTDATTQINPYEEWELTYLPHPGTIRVFIDGAIDGNWHYDSPSNKVMFDVIPPPTSFVEMGYIIKGS